MFSGCQLFFHHLEKSIKIWASTYRLPTDHEYHAHVLVKLYCLHLKQGFFMAPNDDLFVSKSLFEDFHCFGIIVEVKVNPAIGS